MDDFKEKLMELANLGYFKVTKSIVENLKSDPTTYCRVNDVIEKLTAKGEEPYLIGFMNLGVSILTKEYVIKTSKEKLIKGVDGMNELIKISTIGEEITLSARELHEFLEVKTPYTKWFDRMAEYGFDELRDYRVTDIFVPNSNGGKQIQVDHEIKLDMAKEIAMIQRSEKGKQARQYFINVEKDWNSPDKIMERALMIAKMRVEKLALENSQQKQIIGELKPKADYTDFILKNKGLVTTTQISKDYGLSAQEMNSKLHDLGIQYKQSGQWLLYYKHHSKGYTHSETIPITRKDGRPDITMTTKWTQKGRLFIYDLLKQHDILPTIEREV